MLLVICAMYQVESLIAIELAYINTNHPDFVGGTRAAYESMARKVSLEINYSSNFISFVYIDVSVSTK